MRAEINMVLLFPDKTTKEIKGFFKVDAYAEEEDVVEYMADFIEEHTRDYIDDFNTGIAEVFIDDEVFISSLNLIIYFRGRAPLPTFSH